MLHIRILKNYAKFLYFNFMLRMALRHTSTIKFLLSFYMSFIPRHPRGYGTLGVLFYFYNKRDSF